MPLRRIEQSFGLKMIGAVIVSLLFTALAFTTLAYLHHEKTASEQFIKKGKMLARLAASYTGESFLLKDKIALGNSLARFGDVSQVLSVLILDSEHHEIAAHHDRLRDSGNLNNVHFLHPITREGGEGRKDIVGYAAVVLDNTHTEQESRKLLLHCAVTGVFFLLAGGFLIYTRIRRVTRSLGKLDDAVRSIGAEEATERIPFEVQKEIGPLAASINVMIESLERRTIDQKLLEEQLRYAQKMEAVGTLARGISHDFNNILATIKGAVHILQKQYGEEPFLQRYAVKIENSIKKANTLIDGLITFSRTKMIQDKIVDINKIIEKMKPLITDIAEESGIQVRIFLSRELVLIRGDAFCIEQVLWNLCINARDAMPDGGMLTIRTDIISGGGGPEVEDQHRIPCQYVLISVVDTGVGIDEEKQKRIFEPFFTTKDTGKGTGLGLSVVHGIIEQHRGRIELATPDGEGTTFTIYLPLSD